MKLTLTVSGCNNLEAKDKNGKSDPFCYVGIRSKKEKKKDEYRKEYKTKVIKKNLYPKWNETFVFEDVDCMDDVVDFRVFDWDRFSKNEPMGDWSIKVRKMIDFTPETTRIGKNGSGGASLKHTTRGKIFVSWRLENVDVLLCSWKVQLGPPPPKTGRIPLYRVRDIDLKSVMKLTKVGEGYEKLIDGHWIHGWNRKFLVDRDGKCFGKTTQKGQNYNKRVTYVTGKFDFSNGHFKIKSSVVIDGKLNQESDTEGQIEKDTPQNPAWNKFKAWDTETFNEHFPGRNLVRDISGTLVMLPVKEKKVTKMKTSCADWKKN